MNTPEGFQCDHIDGNTLNNQKSNLRNVTCQQNGCNKSKCKNLFSKYKGVSRVKRDKKWQAYITVHQKPIFLGCFTNELDAAVAYNNAAIKYFGEYAKLNQIEIAVN
jgi:hypothetical protein